MADGRWHGSIGNGLTTEDEEHSSETTEKARRGAQGIRAPRGSRSSTPARPRHLPWERTRRRRMRQTPHAWYVALGRALMMPHPPPLFVRTRDLEPIRSQPKLCDVPKESHFMRQRNVLVMATLPLLGLSLMMGSVGASGGGGSNAPAPLSTIPVPLPSN